MTSLKHCGITAHFFRVILVLLSPKHGVTSKISFAGICCFLVCPFLFVGLFSPRLRRPLLPFHSCAFNSPPPLFQLRLRCFFLAALFSCPLFGLGGVGTVRRVHEIGVRTVSFRLGQRGRSASRPPPATHRPSTCFFRPFFAPVYCQWCVVLRSCDASLVSVTKVPISSLLR